MTRYEKLTDVIDYVNTALGNYAADYDTEAIAREISTWTTDINNHGREVVTHAGYEITADDDTFWAIAARRKRAVTTATITTCADDALLDATGWYTEATIITTAGDIVDTLRLPTSENTARWNELADLALRTAGWRRITDWYTDASATVATVTRIA